MKSSLTSIVCAAALLIAVPAAAQQPRPARPYRGLFGGGMGDTEQVLTLTGSVGVGYDDNVLADQSGTGGLGTDPRIDQSGTFQQMSGGLTYSLERTRVSLGASLG